MEKGWAKTGHYEVIDGRLLSIDFLSPAGGSPPLVIISDKLGRTEAGATPRSKKGNNNRRELYRWWGAEGSRNFPQ
jgi:hypothetical protein